MSDRICKLKEATSTAVLLSGIIAGLAVDAIPLALAIFLALAIYLLPDAVGPHQSWVHILSVLTRPEVPHELFFVAKQVLIASWLIAFLAKLFGVNFTRDVEELRKRHTRKRRNEAKVAVRHAVEKLEMGPVTGMDVRKTDSGRPE